MVTLMIMEKSWSLMIVNVDYGIIYIPMDSEIDIYDEILEETEKGFSKYDEPLSIHQYCTPFIPNKSRFWWIPQLDKKSFGEVWQKSSLAEWFASCVGGGGGGGGGVFDRDGGKKEGGRRKRGSCTYLGHFQATITIDSVKSKLDIAMTWQTRNTTKFPKLSKKKLFCLQ